MRPIALALACVASLVAGCLGSPSDQVESRPALHVEDLPQRPGVPCVLVLMPQAEAAVQLRQALLEELDSTFNVRTRIDHDLTRERLQEEITSSQPDALVLIDNRSVTLYRAYQRAQPPGTRFPPALILMAAFARESARALDNASVITHEVPGVTGVVALRRLVERPIHRLGVVYRRPFSDFVARHRMLSRVENVELVDVAVPQNPGVTDVGWALHQILTGPEAADALWVLNDNILLTPELLRDAWLPAVHAFRPPVIVGAQTLVSRRLDFGSIAIVPDIPALALQAAQRLSDLTSAGWQAAPNVEPPIAVYTVVDAAQAEEFLGLRPHALEDIDRVVR